MTDRIPDLPPPGPWFVERPSDTAELALTYPSGWLVKRWRPVLQCEYGGATQEQIAAQAAADALNAVKPPPPVMDMGAL